MREAARMRGYSPGIWDARSSPGRRVPCVEGSGVQGCERCAEPPECRVYRLLLDGLRIVLNFGRNIDGYGYY